MQPRLREKNHEMEFKRLTMERDVQEKKQALERNRRKQVTGKNEQIRFYRNKQ